MITKINTELYTSDLDNKQYLHIKIYEDSGRVASFALDANKLEKMWEKQNEL